MLPMMQLFSAFGHDFNTKRTILIRCFVSENTDLNFSETLNFGPREPIFDQKPRILINFSTGCCQDDAEM